MPFLDRPGASLYYDVVGRGRPIVFVHGLGGSHTSWWQQVPALADRWTCVVFAARGFFPSRVSEPLPGDASVVDCFLGDLAALIHELQLEGVSLVAQSLGGWPCLEYTLAHPDQVRRLVLADTTGTVRPTVNVDSALSESLFTRGIHPACGERMYREQPELHWLYRSIDELSLGLDKPSIIRGLAAARIRDVTSVADLTVPVLGIAGAEDVVIAARAVEDLVTAMPNGRYEEVPAAGHSVYFERATTFNHLVEDFLAD
jgi:3-oxoadipate enol-lactonase